jgi:hypothetical protein
MGFCLPSLLGGSFVAGTEAHAEAPRLRWLVHTRSLHVILAGGPMRLGVFSGTFNPPTLAHLLLAREAARQLAPDEFLFVVPEVPPHKADLEAALADRAEMLKRTLAGEARFTAALSSHGLLINIHRALVPEYPSGTKA